MISFLEHHLSKWRVQLAFSFLLVAVVLMPVLSGQKVFGDDAMHLVIPQLAFYKDAIAKGESLFWNPYVAVGFPNFVSTGHPFAPTALLVRLLPPVDAHYWTLFVLLSLTLFFSARFIRELGVGVWGSLIGGMSYIIVSIWYTQSTFSALGILNQAIIFWVLIKISQSKSSWTSALLILIGGLSSGYLWLSIGYWYNLYAFSAALAFVIFLGYRNRDVFRKVLTCFLILGCVGVAIGLLQLVPSYVMAQYSGRGGGLDYQSAQGYAIGFRELLNFFHLTPQRGLDAYLYMGIVPLFFFILSFWSRDPHAKFFRWVFLITFAIAIKGSPLFWLINKLPIFNMFQGAARFLLISNFASAVLVGVGSEQFLNLLKQGKLIFIKRFVNISVVVAACVMLFAVLILWDQATNYSVLASVAVLMLAYATFTYFYNKPQLLAVLALITIFDFVFIFYSFHVPSIADRKDYDQPAVVSDFLRVRGGRILPLFVDDWDDLYFYQIKNTTSPPEGEQPYAYRLSRETYWPNFQLLDGIENLEANEPLLNVEMGRLMALLGTRQLVTAGGEEKLNKVYFMQDGQDLSAVKKVQTLKKRHSLIDFLGVRYLLSAYDLVKGDAEIADLIHVAYAPLNIMGNGSPPMPLFVFENPISKPLAYFTKVSGYKTDPQEIYNAFKAGGFKDIFVECSDCPPEKFTGAGEITQTKKENGLLELEAVSVSNQFLVFTQNYLPGWRAFIDGAEVKMYKVNTVFPGIFVPAGEHKVKFKYDYWSLFSPKLIFGKR